MKVILQQDVRGQGKKGQMIDAAEGYARNYLLPRKLAIPATADAINTMNLKEKARRAEEAANRAAAVETADKLRNCTVKITAKGGANGKLFGAITGKEISEALMAQFGLDVGKQKIVLDEPIKAFGSYEDCDFLCEGDGEARLRGQREVHRDRGGGISQTLRRKEVPCDGRTALPPDAALARGGAGGARLDAHRRELH